MSICSALSVSKRSVPRETMQPRPTGEQGEAIDVERKDDGRRELPLRSFPRCLTAREFVTICCPQQLSGCMNRMTRAACLLGFLTACARPHPASAPLPLECTQQSFSRIVDTDSGGGVDGQSAAGRVVTTDGRKPIPEAEVVLFGDSARRQFTDSTGAFHFAGVPSGHYRLMGRRMGYKTVAESLTVPVRRGVEVQLATAPEDEFACWNAQILAERPILTLQRAESVTIERVLPNGPRMRHTVVAAPTKDGISFRSRVVNLGPGPARVMTLCYPKATAPVLKELIFVGPGCVGGGAEIAPGDSGTITTGGPLRGRPGRYSFQVHAIDPALLDVTIRLELVEVFEGR